MMKQKIKNITLTILPARILNLLKKFHYSRSIRTITENNETDLKVIRHLVRLNDTAVDIGANIGVYTKFLSQFVGDQGRVISVEPIPTTYGFLKHNVKALKLGNVALFNCAMSAENKTVVMSVPDYKSGGKNFYEARIVSDEDNTSGNFRVEAKTIDSLLQDVSNITLIKCDVEGHELHCIEGAAKTIERYKPAWCIESASDLGTPGTPAYRISQILGQSGYQAYYFDGKMLKAWHAGAKSVNYFFLTPKHLGLIPKEF